MADFSRIPADPQEGALFGAQGRPCTSPRRDSVRVCSGFVWHRYLAAADSEGTRVQLDERRVGLLSTIPYIASVAGMLIWARAVDRRGRRVFHLVASCLAGGVGLVLSALSHGIVVELAGLTVAVVAVSSLWGTNRRAAQGRPHQLELRRSHDF